MNRTALSLAVCLAAGCFSEPPMHFDEGIEGTEGSSGVSEKNPSGGGEDEDGTSTGGWEHETTGGEGSSTGEPEDESSTGEGPVDPMDCSQECWLPSHPDANEFLLPYQPDAVLNSCASDIAGLDSINLGILSDTLFHFDAFCMPKGISDAYEACGEQPNLVHHFAASLKVNCEAFLEAYGCAAENTAHGLGYQDICDTFMVQPYLAEFKALPPHVLVGDFEEAGACETTIPDPSC